MLLRLAAAAALGTWTMLKTLIGLSAALAASAASAATFIFAPGSGALGAGEVLLADFNTPANDALVSGSGFLFLTGNSAQGALPAAGDHSRYLSVTGNGSASIAFAAALTGFSLDIGSVDSYNGIRLAFAGGGFQTFTGSQLVANADGNQLLDRTNGRFSFFATGDERIAELTFLSGRNSFELDNLAVSMVPEPATWGLMLIGFGLVGYAVRRRLNAERGTSAPTLLRDVSLSLNP